MFKKFLCAAIITMVGSPAITSAQDIFIEFSSAPISNFTTVGGGAIPVQQGSAADLAAATLLGDTLTAEQAPVGATGTAFVFVRNGFDVSQLENLEISSSNPRDVPITSAQLLQFSTLNVVPGGVVNTRWTEPATATLAADGSSFELFATIFGNGVNPTATGISTNLSTFDDGFSTEADAFLLAQFDYSVLRGGGSTFEFTGGGVSRYGTLYTVDGGLAEFGSATIEPVPEPTSAIVLAITLVGLTNRRIR